jgi:hypothetical protein
MKLSNRGSKQAIGIVTDVSFFLSVLAGELDKQCGSAKAAQEVREIKS